MDRAFACIAAIVIYSKRSQEMRPSAYFKNAPRIALYSHIVAVLVPVVPQSCERRPRDSFSPVRPHPLYSLVYFSHPFSLIFSLSLSPTRPLLFLLNT